MSFIKDTFFGGAEKKAAKAQLAGVREGIAEQRRQFDVTQGNIQPSIDAGNLARDRLLQILGLNGPEAQQEAFSNFIESPGQAFLRERGNRAVQRGAAATGGIGGGDVLKALTEFGIGTAATQQSDLLDRLGLVSGSGDRLASVLGGIGANTASNISNLSRIGGDAKAAGITGRASGIRGGLARIAGAFI